MKASVWIDRLITAKGLPSDYAAAKLLGIRPQTISAYRANGGAMDEAISLKVAHELGINSAILLADQAMERSKDQEARTAWGTILERLGGLAASILLASGLAGGVGSSPDVQAAGSSQNNSGSTTSDIYIVSSRKRKKKAPQRGYSAFNSLAFA